LTEQPKLGIIAGNGRQLNTSQTLEKLRSEPDRGEDVEMLIRFIETSERGVIE
jgi:hypothetical protein